MIKEKYLRLIKCLRHNCRDSITKMSENLNSPVSTVFDRLNNTKKFIKKFTSIVDFDKLGLIRTKIMIIPYSKRKILDFILKNKNVNSAYTLETDCKILLDCLFRNKYEYMDFIRELKILPIYEKTVYFVEEELKVEEYLSS